MNLTVQTINILMLLLPGFIGLRFLSLLTGVHSESLWKHLIDSVIFSFVVYVPLEIFGLWAPLLQIDPEDLNILIAAPEDISIILFSSLLVSATYARLSQLGWLASVFRFFGLSSLTAHESAWHDVMSKKKYLKLICKNREILLGWPRYYSLSPDYGFLYLENVHFFDESSDEWKALEDAEGLLLRYDDVESVEVASLSTRG